MTPESEIEKKEVMSNEEAKKQSDKLYQMLVASLTLKGFTLLNDRTIKNAARALIESTFDQKQEDYGQMIKEQEKLRDKKMGTIYSIFVKELKRFKEKKIKANNMIKGDGK